MIGLGGGNTLSSKTLSKEYIERGKKRCPCVHVDVAAVFVGVYLAVTLFLYIQVYGLHARTFMVDSAKYRGVWLSIINLVLSLCCPLTIKEGWYNKAGGVNVCLTNFSISTLVHNL